MQRFPLYSVAAASAALLLAACGGGGGSTLPHTGATPTPVPTATAQALPAPSPASNSASLSPSAVAAVTQALPATGGITPTVTIPKLTSGSGNLAITVATGSDATMVRSRQASVRRPQAMAGGPYLLQMNFVPDHDMTFSGAPGFSLDVTQYVTGAGFTIAQAAAYLQGQTLYAGIVDDAGNFTVAGPLTISSTSTALTVSYAGPAVSVTLLANQQYTIGVHAGPITAPTTAPTAAPSTAPSSSPTAPPTASPAASPSASPAPSPSASPMTVTEIPVTGIVGSATSIASGPDGNVWAAGTFYNSNNRQVQGLARITPSGSVTVFDSGITAAFAVAAGPDNNIWYIGNSSDVIGKLNPSTGAVTEFSYPLAMGGGLDITTGPDGDLWFTTISGIGKIDPASGAVTVLTTNASPSSLQCNITSGADGNAYVAGNFSGSGISGNGGILQITPSGTMTAYDYTDINSGSYTDAPHGVTVGPNADIWFTSSGFLADFSSTIARYYSGYNSGYQLECVASGSDGNLWVTDAATDALYRVTTSGTVTPFSTGITTGAEPDDIIAGPDGNLWFTEAGASTVGRFNLR